MELNQSLGFVNNPFSKKSAEQEINVLKKIFFEPNYYSNLKSDLSSGDSQFIIGQRGHGKTAIINKLVEDLEHAKDRFVIQIDRFDSIPIKRNETALLKLILSLIITKLSVFLDKDKSALKSLTRTDKQKLAILIRCFFKTISAEEYNNIYYNIHPVKQKNRVVRLWNTFVRPVNKGAEVILTVSSKIMQSKLGLEEVSVGSVPSDFFASITEIDFSKIDSTDFSKTQLKDFLDVTIHILNNLNFKSTIVLFDKIDEYQELNQDVSKIASFTSEILTDTELLQNRNLAIGFSLWSELKAELSGLVRFDKFGSVDVRWKLSDLEPLIDKRLAYFSNNTKKLSDLIPNEYDRQEVINLAHKSPRDLITLLSEIHLEQSNNNESVIEYDSNSIYKGKINFCRNYDYQSLHPSKTTGKGKEIKSMINKILQIKLTVFTAKNLTDTLRQTTSQTEGQLKLMISYKLIKENEIHDNNGHILYEVTDPKIVFLVKNTVSSVE